MQRAIRPFVPRLSGVRSFSFGRRRMLEARILEHGLTLDNVNEKLQKNAGILSSGSDRPLLFEMLREKRLEQLLSWREIKQNLPNINAYQEFSETDLEILGTHYREVRAYRLGMIACGGIFAYLFFFK